MVTFVNKLYENTLLETTTLHMVFWNIFLWYNLFLLPQAKRSVIITNNSNRNYRHFILHNFRRWAGLNAHTRKKKG